MAPLLSVRAVRAGYSGSSVLKGIDLHHGRGEVVALLGSNGAGKTTLLRVIAGLLPQTSGQISFDGSVLDDLPAHERARRGLTLVPEGRRLFPELTVLENLKAGTLVRRSDYRQDLARAFRLFPVLEQKAKNGAATLSGGEQQMLAIGRGLMSSPQLLMLDEPSVGLSPIAVRLLYDALAQLAGEGHAILLAEQNLTMVLKIAKRGYVLRNGTVVCQGTAEELRSRTDLPELYMGKALA